MAGKYSSITSEDLIAGYRAAGSKKGCAKLMHMPWSSFRDLWEKRIGDAKIEQVSKKATHKVGVISDLHYGSKYSCPEEVRDFVDHCVEEGVKTILIGGDISDGLQMRKGHANEVFLQGIDEIVEYVAAELPERAEIEYYAITGNHDNALVKLCGVDLGMQIAKERADFHYMGYTKSSVVIDGNVLAFLYHGAGNCTQNRTVRLQSKVQQTVESCITHKLPIPEVYLLGHCHHSSVVYGYYGSLAIGLASFQRQTPYLAEKGLMPDVGGIILEYVSDGVGLLQTPKIEFKRY